MINSQSASTQNEEDYIHRSDVFFQEHNIIGSVAPQDSASVADFEFLTGIEIAWKSQICSRASVFGKNVMP